MRAFKLRSSDQVEEDPSRGYHGPLSKYEEINSMIQAETPYSVEGDLIKVGGRVAVRKSSENKGMSDWDYQHMKELGLKFGKNGKVIVDVEHPY